MNNANGFALPTVIIASVVMMMVLLSGLTASSSVNTAIRSQYYNKLAQRTAESGVAFTQACLKKNNYVPQWSNANPLRPNTDCTGLADSGYSCPTPTSTTGIALEPRCGVIETNDLRTTFSVSGLAGTGPERTATITATVYMLRASSGRTVASSQTVEVRQSVTFKNNPSASRPAKRYWLFGQAAGLDFGVSGTSTPTVIDAPCSPGPCYAGEGSTVISSQQGILQFWSDGRTIWNRNGGVMPNGGGLLANASTTQAAAVFPYSPDETKYVVVTNNTEAGVNNAGELNYSIVDMSAQGGLGDVTTKNVPVWNGVADYSSEASTAAPKADGTGYWILTFTPGTTSMRVFSFNSLTQSIDGVATYNAPAGITRGTDNPTQSGFGSLNFNQDYTKLVMMAGNHCLGTCAAGNGLLRTMSFNTANGAITNQNEWNLYTGIVTRGYSADFSPAGTYVYASSLYPAYLYRYNISGVPNNTSIKSSEEVVGLTQVGSGNPACTGGGQVLRAPDNKMYVANCGERFIWRLNTPDASGTASTAVGWQSVYLSGTKLSSYGLPQLVTIYSPVYQRY